MKKRLMLIVLTLVMILSLVGCKNKPAPDAEDNTPPVNQEQVDKDQPNTDDTDKEDGEDGTDVPPVSDKEDTDTQKPAPDAGDDKPDADKPEGDDASDDHEHKYTDKVVAPTCKAEGYTQHTCTVCGDSYKDTITKKVAHKYTDKVVAATCKAEGYTQHTCSVCGDTYKDSKTPKANHKYTDKVIAATCTTGGYTQHTCSVCGYIAKDTNTSKLGHNYTDKVVAPTATAQGYTIHTCGRCGTSYKDSYTPATGNSGNSGSSSGSTTPSTPSTPSHQHSYSANVVPATCTTKGYTTYTCSCGHSYTADYNGGEGHSYEPVYEEVPVYETVQIMRCGACHANLDDVGGIAHVKEEALAGNPGGGSSYGDTIEVFKGYSNELVGYACSVCGAER